MTFTMPEQFAQGDYPTTWSSFIGQDKAKEQIKLAADSAKIRGVPMDHMLIASGSPGIGKTSLALLAAREMGTGLTVVAPPLPLEHAALFLADMDDGDILFIDEAHKLVEGGKKNAEWLLHYLQDGVLLGPYRFDDIPKVTVIAATTEAGRIPATVVGRFPVRPQLTPYTDDEGALITAALAVKVMGDQPAPTPANCAAITRAGNNNPRAIRQILTTLRDMAVTGALEYGQDGWDVPAVLDWHGIADDGLDATAQKYLVVLHRDFSGKAGQKAIEERLQEPGGLAETERVLIEKGFIAKTATGRVLTVAGARRTKKVAA